MKKYLFSLLMLASVSAFADVSAGATAVSGAASQSGASSAALQGNQQAITLNSAPAPASTSQQVKYDGDYTLRTVATVYAPPVGVTAPCLMGYSGGVTVVGFGGSFGGSVEDVKCTRRETARLLHAMGKAEAGIKVMCNEPEAAVALGAAICPQPVVTLPEKEKQATATPITVAKNDSPSCYSDEIVASRTGKPVCK